MKQLFKRVAAGVLCAAVLFAAGCGSAGDQERVGPMGRYVETILSYPDGQVMKQMKRSDGSIDVYVYDHEIRDLVLFNSRDGILWEEKEFPWINQEGVSVMDYVYGQNDEIYILSCTTTGGYQDGVNSPTRATYRIYRAQADGALWETPIHWEAEYGITWFADEFLAGDDGDLFVLQMNEGIVQYDGQTGEQKRVYQLAQAADEADKTIQNHSMRNLFAAGFGKLFLGDPDSSSIRIYDTVTGEMQTTTSFDALTADSLMCLGADGDLYVQNAGGLYRLVENGTFWEEIINGALTALSTPVKFTELLAGEARTFYLRGSDSLGSRLYRYQYDETVASIPTHEIVVYSLKDNYLIQYAAGVYQRKHPDTKVNVQVASEAEALLKSELIRALNTELLAGKGPDIIVLDDMNIQSYIGKGALLDIGDTVSQSEELLEHVVNSLAENDGLYAVPAGFRLPVFAAETSTLSQAETLREAARFAQENPQVPLLGDASYKGIFHSFLHGSAPAFLKDGQIDRAALREYLECVKIIADASGKNHGDSEDKHPVELVFDFAFHRSHGYTERLQSMFSVQDMSAAMENRGDCSVVPLPGLCDRVFVPNNIVGINVNTTQEEKAREFIQILLSEEVQEYQTYGGFPVNEKALLASIESEKEVVTTPYFNIDAEGENMLATMPPLEMQQRVYELILSAATPSVLDSALVAMIENEAEGYFTGSKTIDQAISDIEEAAKLYLSE